MKPKRLGDRLLSRRTHKRLVEDLDRALDIGVDARFAEVEKKIKGWQVVVNSPGFSRWAASQTALVRSLMDSPVPSDAIVLVNAYLKHCEDAVAKIH